MGLIFIIFYKIHTFIDKKNISKGSFVLCWTWFCCQILNLKSKYPAKKKVPRVTVSRLDSNMADGNVEGDMEVETKNPATFAYSNEINFVINGKTKQNMHIFLYTV